MYDTLVYKTGAVPSEYFSLKKRPGYKEYQEKQVNFFHDFNDVEDSFCGEYKT